MPIDRPRRDAVAFLLRRHLLGELPPNDCYHKALPIIDARHHIAQGNPKGESPGFPVIFDNAPSPEPLALDDQVLESCVSRALHAGLFHHKRQKLSPEQRHDLLVRTLALLRSDLGESNLCYPRLPQPRPLARTKLLLIAAAALATTIAAALAFHPLYLLAWPILGALLLCRRTLFFLPAISEPLDAYPLLSVAQFDSIAPLIQADRIPPFQPDRYPPKQRQTTPRARMPRLLFAPLAFVVTAIAAAMFIAGLVIAGILLLIFWPAYIFSSLRSPQHT